MIENLISYKDIGIQLFTAGVGGMVTMTVGYGYTLLKNKKIESKYKISGKYLTQYEDEFNGDKKIVSAPLTLKQYGHRLHGDTKLENRKWILDGNISEEGYIYGRYYAENKHDKGVGNFFLRIDRNGDMHGMWSGYDDENKKINAGTYAFKKLDNDVEIVSMEQSMLPSVVDIASHRLGDSFISEEILENDICLCAKSGKKIVGFCTGKFIKSDILKNRFKDKKLKLLDVCDQVGYVGSIAVDKSYEGRGIGTLLLRDTIAKLEEKNICLLIMTAWKSGNDIYIKGLAEKEGFKEEFEIEKYWEVDSIEHNYDCAVCGKPPCKCSAVVFTKKMNQ